MESGNASTQVGQRTWSGRCHVRDAKFREMEFFVNEYYWRHQLLNLTQPKTENVNCWTIFIFTDDESVCWFSSDRENFLRITKDILPMSHWPVCKSKVSYSRSIPSDFYVQPILHWKPYLSQLASMTLIQRTIFFLNWRCSKISATHPSTPTARINKNVPSWKLQHGPSTNNLKPTIVFVSCTTARCRPFPFLLPSSSFLSLPVKISCSHGLKPNWFVIKQKPGPPKKIRLST